MSSRALRKLQGHQELEIITGNTNEEESEENEEILPLPKTKSKKKRTPLNPFELLDNEENDMEDLKEHEQEDVMEETQQNEKKTTNSKKKKKKKKKKNKDATFEETRNIEEGEDEIDASIREVNRILQSSGLPTTTANETELLQSTSPVTMNMRALLNVEHKNLNPDNEMKRIFGSRVVQAEMNRRQGHRPRRGQKSWLATPKDSWPPMGKTGLTMSLVENKNGFQYFSFDHSSQYQKVQFEFLEAVESLNPQNIANLLQLHPYHIDGLIQLSEVFRMSEDMQVATELLDPDGDPMCVLLMIDFYALRAEEYTFLIRLYNEWELQSALIMFPGLLLPLLDKCGISPDKDVSSHDFFGPKSQYQQPDALKQLIGLYVGRCHPSWKVAEVMTWLETNVKKVLERVDAKDSFVQECCQKLKLRYKGTPRNILRHILISEVKDATAALPPDLANTTVLSYDPLPPPDSIESYTRPERPRRIQQEGNVLSTFLRSLLPNFDIDEPAGGAEGAVGGDQGGNNLRQGIDHLMDAMRDLLQNIRPVEPPVENQNGDEENVEHPDEDEFIDEWD
ncbi:hypothetical protein KUTeg_018808 [Tegillarca granosa]|uniref:Transcription factor 25 n=1 Tax=Tegillarca granosa TaxID=220873 RepID=A0ABQ9EFR4_TEGGR|nr:hypothetical protein KUTeg_018808 [Tegillarca granosa]